MRLNAMRNPHKPRKGAGCSWAARFAPCRVGVGAAASLTCKAACLGMTRLCWPCAGASWTACRRRTPSPTRRRRRVRRRPAVPAPPARRTGRRDGCRRCRRAARRTRLCRPSSVAQTRRAMRAPPARAAPRPASAGCRPGRERPPPGALARSARGARPRTARRLRRVRRLAGWQRGRSRRRSWQAGGACAASPARTFLSVCRARIAWGPPGPSWTRARAARRRAPAAARPATRGSLQRGGRRSAPHHMRRPASTRGRPGSQPGSARARTPRRASPRCWRQVRVRRGRAQGRG